MVERISSGATARPSADALGVSGKSTGKSTGKSAIFSKRLAQKENIAQTRQAGASAGKLAVRSKVSTRTNSRGDLSPARPRAPTIESRETRRARLQETGKQLAQHKRDVAQAKDSHQRDVTQRIEQERARASTLSGGASRGGRDLTGKDKTGKDVAEVKWGTLDKHGMINKLRQLDEISAHKAAGRDYKMLKRPALAERKAVLREGHQGFASRLGSKIKDALMRIFLPRQWRVHQEGMAQARRDDIRAAELFANNLFKQPINKELAAHSEAAFVEERRVANLRDVSDNSVEVEEVEEVKHSIPRDESVQKNPRYEAEKAVLEKGIEGLRKEMEDEAKRHINEVLAKQQARAGGEVAEKPTREAVKGREIRGDGSRRDSTENPNATSL